jgi:hypothetical protein
MDRIIRAGLNLTLLFSILLFSGFISPFSIISPETPDIDLLYHECGIESYLSADVFRMAITGMERIDTLNNKKILTIIDYSKPSANDRFFVIDLENHTLLYKTLVAHGKNSGEYKAVSFSNQRGSLKSSLGFFITGETYTGKQGYSLKLDGLEPGFNDRARERAIVIHGADYVSRAVAKEYGRLGKSWGCPALPENVAKKIIDKISNGTCLFIYGNDQEYLKNSKILNQN